jgi:hypothetical protein
MTMTELPPDDQAGSLPPPVDAAEMRTLLREHRAWRDHRNRNETEEDGVFFERVVDLGHAMLRVTP